MLTKATRFPIAALFTASAFAQVPAAQTLDQVLHVTHAEIPQQLQEIATVIRGISELPQISADRAQETPHVAWNRRPDRGRRVAVGPTRYYRPGATASVATWRSGFVPCYVSPVPAKAA